jgi:hypothetical protein
MQFLRSINISIGTELIQCHILYNASANSAIILPLFLKNEDFGYCLFASEEAI